MVVGGGGVGCGGGEVVSTGGEASGAGVEDAWPKGIICSAASTLKNRVSGGVYGVADALRKNGCQPGWAVPQWWFLARCTTLAGPRPGPEHGGALDTIDFGRHTVCRILAV
jgi:hypothetical protein